MIVCVALASCGGGGGTSASPQAAATPAPRPTGTAGPPFAGMSLAQGDDWITFAHDLQRTSTESLPTGIDKQTVSSLQLELDVP